MPMHFFLTGDLSGMREPAFTRSFIVQSIRFVQLMVASLICLMLS